MKYAGMDKEKKPYIFVGIVCRDGTPFFSFIEKP